jgi:hypothetical protein
MRWVVLFLLAGCSKPSDCSAIVPCGSGRHYQVCNVGGANGCSFLAADGSRFQCTSCGDCQSAMALVQAWCGMPGGSTTSGGTTGTSGLMCQTTACPQGGGSYEFCASAAATQCEFHAGGQNIPCVSCANCTDAATQVAQWCGGGGTTGSGGTTTGSTTGGGTTTGATTGGGTTTGGPPMMDSDCPTAAEGCFVCCRDLHVTQYIQYLKHLDDCSCPSCTASCTSATDVCHGGNDFISPCSDCLKMANTNCYATADTACNGDAACSAYSTCTAGCP